MAMQRKIAKKRCRKCLKEKPLSEFVSRTYMTVKGPKRSLRTYCKGCDREKTYRWRKAHPEQYQAIQRRHREKLKSLERLTN